MIRKNKSPESKSQEEIKLKQKVKELTKRLEFFEEKNREQLAMLQEKSINEKYFIIFIKHKANYKKTIIA